MVTPCAARPLRATPATNPVKPLRAPLDKPSTSIGALTAPEAVASEQVGPAADEVYAADADEDEPLA